MCCFYDVVAKDVHILFNYFELPPSDTQTQTPTQRVFVVVCFLVAGAKRPPNAAPPSADAMRCGVSSVLIIIHADCAVRQRAPGCPVTVGACVRFGALVIKMSEGICLHSPQYNGPAATGRTRLIIKQLRNRGAAELFAEQFC